jgi:hypothetical protein
MLTEPKGQIRTESEQRYLGWWNSNSMTIGLFFCGLLTSGSLLGQSTESWSPLATDALPPAQQAQYAAATSARDALFNGLMERLQDVIKEQGLARAIAVCAEEAPKIAQKIGKERGVRIGRTSHKLRNHNNRPPTWAQPLVQARVKEPRVLLHSDGRLAVLLPIRLKSQCLVCHGPETAIPNEVRTALRERYPNDQAIGFGEDELRGWFWVEVPPTKDK